MKAQKALVGERSHVLDEGQMKAFLRACYHWYENASSPSQQSSRSRVLLICLLIRFAALRLGEALSLNDRDDIDVEKGVLHVRGKWKRELPLPRTALTRLLELRDAPYNIRAKGELCRVDPAYVRRMFNRRAEEAGLSGMSPTGLRDFREQELLRHGVPLRTVEFFLGRRRGGQPVSGEITYLREIFRQWEYTSQTGRHNIVKGMLTVLRQGDFSTYLHLTTPAGTHFLIQCSTRTFARLDLAARHEASVFIRSLQVMVLSEKVAESNCFAGEIADILEKGDEARVMIRLAHDPQQFCAILSMDRVRELRLRHNAQVWVMIRPEDFTFCETGSGEL